MTQEPEKSSTRNIAAFWLIGACTNFGYYQMNAAAQDILHKHAEPSQNVTAVRVTEHCEPFLDSRHCSPHSASLVLLCNILPGLIIKILYPLIAKFVPYGVRHAAVCILQATSLLLVALSDSVPLALFGVLIGSVQSGLGESAYLGLASHYSRHTISYFSAGTGMSGILGSFSYAGLTDHRLGGLTSSQAMLVSLVIPLAFAIAYYIILQRPDSVRKVSILEPKAWIGLDRSKEKRRSEVSMGTSSLADAAPKKTLREKWVIVQSLLKYMIPLFLVYFAEYLINQGLVELVIFDCAHGFGTSLRAQYRWYQVLYQVGVFISRSSGNIFQMSMVCILLMPLLQLLNAIFFLFDSIYAFVPHFGIMAAIVLYEGLIGGGAYVHSYNHIHRNIDPSIKEFALSVVTLADTAGIVVAALTAIPIHNAICAIPYK